MIKVSIAKPGTLMHTNKERILLSIGAYDFHLSKKEAERLSRDLAKKCEKINEGK